FRHLFHEVIHAVPLDQTDGTAAKTAARHSGAANARRGQRQIDHEIELGTAHLEVIPKAAVRFTHQHPESIEIALLQRLRRALHASVLADDVAAAAINRLGESIAITAQIGERYIAKGADMRQEAD